MRVLVTGASGFIGRHVCTLLRDQGHDVIGMTRSASAHIDGVRYCIGDLADQAFVARAVSGVDCIVHLAGRAHVLDKALDSPQLHQTTNHDLSVALATQAIAAGVKRLVFISSIGVNGNRTDGTPLTESTMPRPLTPYARSKLDAEVALQALAGPSAMEWVIIRPPLVYGAQAPGNFRTLLGVAYKGLPNPFRWVNNRRSLVSVDNLSQLIALAVVHPAAMNEVFLAADDADLSTFQILQALSAGMQKSPLTPPVPTAVFHLAARLLGKSDLYTQLCQSLVVDCAKARRLLGYRPDTQAQEALARIGKAYAQARDASG